MIQKAKYLLVSLFTFATMTCYSQTISEDLALRLSHMPLSCISQEFPNKTSHLSDGITDHKLTPSELHPVFFGCLDWHSSVHGHWLLVKILKLYPNITNRDSIVGLLNESFQLEKIKQEASYFGKYTSSSSYERTYGWAWLLKLDEELKTWDNPQAQKWHKSLQPLTDAIVKLWKDYLPKQTYPNRTGIHPNTAFGLAFALDWARTTSDTAFEKLIIEKATGFYADNQKVPAYFEPDGSDFFSPSLEVADLMRRVYDPKTFTRWFKNYYEKRSLERILELPVVSDRKDYQIVHLDGLAFSRAWCLKGIASHLLNQPALSKRLKERADLFISNTLPNISHDNYGGSHWLASFAFYALQ
ncbi:MAG: hypothetical protein H6Q14_42 [Bacteroidetes bacterium]|nr:hypothetical protein [Bacteroidota bacterium]